jgi:nicotinate-nucleotide adenylyltransferase
LSGIAIFGGAFDPFHNGHLSIVKVVIHLPFIKEMFIIPTHLPPHKKVASIIPKDRLTIIEAVVAELKDQGLYHKKIKISDLEIKRQGVSWTVDTVSEIKKKNPGKDLYLVIGSDSYFKFNTWKRYQEILGMVRLIVIRREDFDRDCYKKFYDASLSMIPYNKFIFLDNDPVIVSSTEVRTMLAGEQSIKGLVPDSVLGFLQ